MQFTFERLAGSGYRLEYTRADGAAFTAKPTGGSTIEDRAHPTAAHYGASFEHIDERCSFAASSRDAASQVLVTRNEASYDPGEGLRMGDHPISWAADSGTLCP